MLKSIKESISDYATIGVVMAVLTTLIRPFISVKKTIRDAVISFVFSMLSGLLVEYWEIPFTVKVGICGTFGFFAVSLYGVAEVILKQVKEDPSIITDRLRKK